jgi:hypothetical protein
MKLSHLLMFSIISIFIIAGASPLMAQSVGPDLEGWEFYDGFDEDYAPSDCFGLGDDFDPIYGCWQHGCPVKPLTWIFWNGMNGCVGKNVYWEDGMLVFDDDSFIHFGTRSIDPGHILKRINAIKFKVKALDLNTNCGYLRIKGYHGGSEYTNNWDLYYISVSEWWINQKVLVTFTGITSDWYDSSNSVFHFLPDYEPINNTFWISMDWSTMNQVVIKLEDDKGNVIYETSTDYPHNSLFVLPDDRYDITITPTNTACSGSVFKIGLDEAWVKYVQD